MELNCNHCGGDNLMDGPLCGACAEFYNYKYRGGGGVLTPAGCPDDYDEAPPVAVAPNCAACENTGYLVTGDACGCAAGSRKRTAEDALDLALIGEDTAQLDTEIWYNEEAA